MDLNLALQSLVSEFEYDFGWHPYIGVEVECYCTRGDGGSFDLAEHLSTIQEELEGRGVALYDVLQERGDNQLEVALHPRTNIRRILQEVDAIHGVINQFCQDHGLTSSFAAKPFEDQPGNGLHIHVSLLSDTHKNQFYKHNEVFSAPLRYAIGGLLASMAQSMLIFAPQEASYGRFLHGSHENDAPTKICWGTNNRTTALRLPDSSTGFRHVEHRVPGGDVNLKLAIFTILAGVHYGLTHRIEPEEPVFGNAFEEKYTKPLLPRNLQEAIAAFHDGEVLDEYFGEIREEILSRYSTAG